MSVSDIPVVILCGGRGTRLQTVLDGAQKVLVDVDDEPFLGLLTRHLAGQGLRRFVYAAGFQGEAVAAFANDLARSLGVGIDVAIESRPLGTGGAIRFAASRFADDRFFVVNGDSLCEFACDAMERFHSERQSLFTMALVAAEPSSDGGFVRLGVSASPTGAALAREASARVVTAGGVDYEDDRLIGFAEKDYHPDHSFLNAGTYLIERRLSDRIPTDRPVSLEKDLLPAWTTDALYGFKTGSILHDIGTPDRLAAFRARISARLRAGSDGEQDGQDGQDG